MIYRKTYSPKGKEAKIQKAIKDKLTLLEWYVKVLVGNAFQNGMPDLFATHKRYGIRLIEVKRPNMEGGRFTNAQLDTFPKLCAHGCGVWVLTSDTNEEYAKLFRPANWHTYLQVMK